MGWVVGHCYIVYGPLLAGCTTILYEGKPVGTPDPGAFWRVCAQHGVRVLFTAPTALRAIRQQDPDGAHMARHDLSRLDALFLAGERCDPPTATWIAGKLSRPVVDHWWQTETGWPITAGFRGLGLFPFKPGAGGRPCPGYDVQALDDAGAPVPRGTVGNLATAASCCRWARPVTSPSACRCRRAARRRCGATRRGSRRPTSTTSRAGIAQGTRARWMRTATCG